MKDNGIGVAGTVVSNASGIVLMSQAVDFVSIIVMLIGIVSGLVSISYNVYKWYKRATHKDSDGGEKITKKELIKGVEDFLRDTEEVFGKEDKDGDKDRK